MTLPGDRVICRVRIEGRLDPAWAERFDGLSVTDDGSGGTLVEGVLADQSALHGFLKTVRDAGMTLLSVSCSAAGARARRDGSMERRSLLSSLWVVVMLTMAFADIVGFVLPGTLQEMMSGSAGGIAVTQPLLLLFAALLEIPIAMILLSRLLPRAASRVVNTIASVITSAFVIVEGTAALHYYFMAGIEVCCMAAVIVVCIRWRADDPARERR